MLSLLTCLEIQIDLPLNPVLRCHGILANTLVFANVQSPEVLNGQPTLQGVFVDDEVALDVLVILTHWNHFTYNFKQIFNNSALPNMIDSQVFTK